MTNQEITIFWFRRDLRLKDNHGFYQALKSGRPVLPLFIFDREILDKLEDKKDKRVQFIHQEITSLHGELEKQGSTLLVKYGKPNEVWAEVLTDFMVSEVYCNRDYEPYARERDENLYTWFKTKDVAFKGYKDQVVFEKSDVVKDDGTPYLVFSPYKRKWKSVFKDDFIEPYKSENHLDALLQIKPFTIPSLEKMGFEYEAFDYPSRKVKKSVVEQYGEKRNFPAAEGTTRIGLHLRFGTVSIRELTRYAIAHNETYWNELIWREFYMMILFHHPESNKKAIKPKYDHIEWENNEDHFEKWCSGKTGYPIVDAGMRELNETGYMHNRVRMIVASFLTKHLLLDWRLGEAYFAQKLLDYEMSSNVGGWQWAAGSGCDAAPYFRVFNPTTQAEKFDNNRNYIKKWVPEIGSDSYPKPIVEHKFARERALARYKEGLAS